MTAKKKKKAAAFEVHNVESLADKPETIGRVWALLDKADPNGDLWVRDVGMIWFDGKSPKGRHIKDLAFTEDEVALMRPYAVVDSPEEDNVEKATGVVLTVYQLVELAYEMGFQDGGGEVTQDLIDAVVGDDDDDDFGDEDGDGGDPDMEVIDEEEDYDADDPEED